MKFRAIALSVSCLLSFVPLYTYGKNPPKVLASIQPLALVAQAIVGERGQVEVLLPSNASAHHYALSISERRRLLSADIVLWVGVDLESFLDKIIAQSSARVITASQLLGISWPEEAKTTHHGDHQHGEHDPHLWLNPLNNKVIIDALVIALGQLAPENASYYKKNAQQLKGALQQLDARLMIEMAPLKTHYLIAAHPAYDHFLQRYGLRQLGYISLTPERSAGAKHLYQLRQQKLATCVLQDYGFPSSAAHQLAKDLGVPLVTLDPLGATRAIASVKMQTGEISEGIVALIEQLGATLRSCVPSKKS
jgi:zinc transport system substrate-binding protein